MKNFSIVLAGNPNVGKSTIFNALTGLHQHTGNWTGKTVSNALGSFKYKDCIFNIADLPGTYSLFAHSSEEEAAADFLRFGKYDTAVVVCDATCLERNLNIVLQICELCESCIVCINLIDEAQRKNISINIPLLSELLNVPVIGVCAKSKGDILRVKEEIYETVVLKKECKPIKIKYPPKIEEKISAVQKNADIDSRWLAVKLIEGDRAAAERINADAENFRCKEALDITAKTINSVSSDIAKRVVTIKDRGYNGRDIRIDKILTGKYTGIPIMLLLLALIFWITIKGANYPSELLSSMFGKIGVCIGYFFDKINMPFMLKSMLLDGVYKVMTWVISVMLPPMAVFFPLFTLLEDLGYLPRIAFNLDHIFKRCGSCGKAALTTCMGFGCNAVGVTGCRIIDSSRERLIAVLTNSFIPCNGRFPTLIAIISIFFVSGLSEPLKSVVSSLILTGLIFLSIIMTFIMSFILSRTILKGVPSNFTLELPPYRKPDIIRIIISSVFDRILFVLGRAVIVALPAGIIIWLSANIQAYDRSILDICCGFLDPLGHIMGLDGVILVSFILGFPANETIIPIMLMAYTCRGTLVDANINELAQVLCSKGWTTITAVNILIFMLFHAPCSTTCLTIKKETKSLKYTVLAFMLPLTTGFLLCTAINLIFG